MTALLTITRTEAKLFAREPLALFFGLVFPSLLLLVIGAVVPGAREPSPDLGGRRFVDLYAPSVIAFSLVTLGINVLPTVLVTYRERGFLRRLATTPLRPARLVLVQLLVHASVGVVATVAALVVGRLAYGVPLPGAPLAFALVLALGMASLFGIGMLVAALAPTSSAAQGMGMAFYFPLLFFAGVYFPLEGMAGPLRAVADLMPSGAVVAGLVATMGGAMPETRDLLVMAAYAVLFTALAVRTFRWE
ncbi:MAG TPA: ABC transporter permease [Trueperaceae bacterium]|jgi:ABC-2 type transport system permease protein